MCSLIIILYFILENYESLTSMFAMCWNQSWSVETIHVSMSGLVVYTRIDEWPGCIYTYRWV